MIRPVLAALLTTLLVCSGCSSNRTMLLNEQQRKITDLNERALASAEKGYNLEAQNLLQEALRLASSLDDIEGKVITLLNQSRLARHTGKNMQAVELTNQALALAKNTSCYADVAQEKSLQEMLAGRLDTATVWAETARSAEQGNNMGRRLNLLARIALLKGNLSEAASLADQALADNKGNGQELEQANSLRILGIVHTRSGKLDIAEEQLQHALMLDKQEAAPAKIAADLDALAELAGHKKDTARQQDYLQRAVLVRKNAQTLIQQTISAP